MDFFYLSGVGKINATFKSLELIHKFNPSQIINYGTAGAINKKCNGNILITNCQYFYIFLRKYAKPSIIDIKKTIPYILNSSAKFNTTSPI